MEISVKTPIADFVKEYVASESVRFHMPGHKGKSFLGCETRDITEISGADALYEAEGIIAESEEIATELFGTRRTLYSTEGSSQCVRAMLCLAVRWWSEKRQQEQKMSQNKEVRPVIVAARNVHKAFMYAAILLDFDIVWLWPEEEDASLCSCVVTAKTLEEVLKSEKSRVAAVYLTSPNYLGKEADIDGISKVCHRHGTLLCIDNAHGAYLRFLKESRHPMDLGADLCCDSAHKTLPVLTGGAYLHISKTAPKGVEEWAKAALELFGSTSPSYLILQSLDLCNAYLTGDYQERLNAMCKRLEKLRNQLQKAGWQVENTDPLRLTIKAPEGVNGQQLAQQLRVQNMECEFADEDYLVLMLTPENTEDELEYLLSVLGKPLVLSKDVQVEEKSIPMVQKDSIQTVCSVREAYFSSGETLLVEQAIGRVCRMPMAACPPAIPVLVPGERIDQTAIECLLYYGIKTIEVVKGEIEQDR